MNFYLKNHTSGEQSYYSHGKVMLVGEYVALFGSKSLGLPTQKGQGLKVSESFKDQHVLHWKSLRADGSVWFEARFETWRFQILSTTHDEKAQVLAKIFKEIRKLNIHFLRSERETLVETVLDFPESWGLGSSSTLIYNIAQWAYVSAFELLSKTFKGSGYDLACAGAEGPILYERHHEKGPQWKQVNFSPSFKKDLYFIYRGHKQSSRSEVKRFLSLEHSDDQKTDACRFVDKTIDTIIDPLITRGEFITCMKNYENMIADLTQLRPLSETDFSDYPGLVKSLGAWGGDFFLCLSDDPSFDSVSYFKNLGLEHIFSYDDFIYEGASKKLSHRQAHHGLSHMKDSGHYV